MKTAGVGTGTLPESGVSRRGKARPSLPHSSSRHPHASDYKPQDWRINLSELLRVIQFFNSAGYHWCNDAAKEGDGYCVGQGEAS
jgi:hypothetical protein